MGVEYQNAVSYAPARGASAGENVAYCVTVLASRVVLIHNSSEVLAQTVQYDSYR